MCGRFNILTDAEALLSIFEIMNVDFELKAYTHQYNISPSPRNTQINEENAQKLTQIPIVVGNKHGQKTMLSAIWPLVPLWAGDCVPKYSTANARSETMTQKASFRNSWRKSQRCLIPASGFYEWQKLPDQPRKQPWHIYHTEQSVMSFAGLWEKGTNTEGESFVSCAIITTQANEMMSEIHNTNHRMPVIIDPQFRELWLTGESQEAYSLAATYGDGSLKADRISTKINNPRYTKNDCIETLTAVDIQ